MGGAVDRNGYGPSIMQHDLTVCFRCGRSREKLDRHEAFGGALRAKSKRLGLWCMLCHRSCHLDGVHRSAFDREQVQRAAQRAAMRAYGWTTEEFIHQFGRNHLC